MGLGGELAAAAVRTGRDTGGLKGARGGRGPRGRGGGYNFRFRHGFISFLANVPNAFTSLCPQDSQHT